MNDLLVSSEVENGPTRTHLGRCVGVLCKHKPLGVERIYPADLSLTCKKETAK